MHVEKQCPTLSEFFEETYRPIRLVGARPATLEEYRISIGQFCRWHSGPIRLADLSTQLLGAWANQLLESGKAPATVNKHMRTIKALWNMAYEEELVAKQPRFRKITEDLTDPICWTPEEIGQLLAAAENEVLPVGYGCPPAWFWRLLILIIYDTGARIGAVMSLRPVDWDDDRCTLRFLAANQKHRKEQTLPVSEDTAALIRRVHAPDRQRLLPWKYDPHHTTGQRVLFRRFGAIIERAGLKADHSKFHRIRRTRATFGELACPGSAQRDLGHSCSRVTARYLDPRFRMDVSVIALLPRPTTTESATVARPTTTDPAPPVARRDPPKQTRPAPVASEPRPPMVAREESFEAIGCYRGWVTPDARDLMKPLDSATLDSPPRVLLDAEEHRDRLRANEPQRAIEHSGDRGDPTHFVVPCRAIRQDGRAVDSLRCGSSRMLAEVVTRHGRRLVLGEDYRWSCESAPYLAKEINRDPDLAGDHWNHPSVGYPAELLASRVAAKFPGSQVIVQPVTDPETDPDGLPFVY